MPNDPTHDPCESLRRSYVDAGEELDQAHTAEKQFSLGVLSDAGTPHFIDPARAAAAKKRVDRAKAAFVTAQIALAECTAIHRSG